jgi:hypothetical protein
VLCEILNAGVISFSKATAVLIEALKQGHAGIDGTQWIVTDALVGSPHVLRESLQASGWRLDALRGLIGIGYSFNQETVTHTQSKLLFDYILKGDSGKQIAGAHGSIEPFYSAFAFDAVLALAHGIRTLENEHDGGVESFLETYFPEHLCDTTRRDILAPPSALAQCSQQPIRPRRNDSTRSLSLYNAIGRSQFDGITGFVSFDENGVERQAHSFQLLQWVPLDAGTPTPHAQMDSKMNCSFQAVISEDGIVDERGFEYMGPSKMAVVVTPHKYRFAILLAYNMSVMDATKEGNDRFQSVIPDLFRKMLENVPGDPASNFSQPLDIELVYTPGLSHSDAVLAVEAGEFDGAVGDFSVSSEREKRINFLPSFSGNAGFVLVVKRPSTAGAGAWAFLHPLSSEVWVATVGFILYGSLVMAYLENNRGTYTTSLEVSQ